VPLTRSMSRPRSSCRRISSSTSSAARSSPTPTTWPRWLPRSPTVACTRPPTSTSGSICHRSTCTHRETVVVMCVRVFSSIFSPITVRNTMSLMFSCGMYDYSGGAIQPMPFSLSLSLSLSLSRSLSLSVTSDRSTAVDSLSRDLQSLRTPSACRPSPVSPAASLLSCPT